MFKYNRIYLLYFNSKIKTKVFDYLQTRTNSVLRPGFRRVEPFGRFGKGILRGDKVLSMPKRLWFFPLADLSPIPVRTKIGRPTVSAERLILYCALSFDLPFLCVCPAAKHAGLVFFTVSAERLYIRTNPVQKTTSTSSASRRPPSEESECSLARGCCSLHKPEFFDLRRCRKTRSRVFLLRRRWGSEPCPHARPLKRC